LDFEGVMSSATKRKLEDEEETEDKPETEEALKEKFLAFKRFEAECKEQKRIRKEKIQINTEKNKEKKKLAESGLDTEGASDEKEVTGRKWTVSIAIPASVLNNAISLEMRTYIAGQIGRAAGVFCVDEIVLYDDGECGSTIERPYKGPEVNSKSNMSLMARLLQYLECPQYLRKYFFPVHDDLKLVGLLNPLDSPHHLRKEEISVYREGVVLEKGGVAKRKKAFVNVGLYNNALLFQKAEPMQRVTVKFRCLDNPQGVLTGDAVLSSTPRTEAGTYWGYDLRLASSFNAVFGQSPYDGGYDITIGVGDEGDDSNTAQVPSFQHAIIVFGGIQSVEQVLLKDDKLLVKDPRDLFDLFVKACPVLNSTHLRTEESLLTALSVLKPKLAKAAASNK